MTPPNNTAAERHLLGVIIRDNLPFPAQLKPSDLFEPQHQDIAAAILSLQADGKAIDETIVSNYLREMK
jgi:replicative DNA helicase